ncbi:MarR family winged helix-turn-helix transcriptional regulator [Phenylobacterium sp.]|uniref:MarR family winged helix-turn-helix transcriptional regulator n=1 Tax=Phenylobacterium sp. TaxID=1871053 RepID=UPI002F939E4C
MLHRAQQLALDVYAQEFGPGSITQRQFALLAAVADYEGANQSDLVRVTGIDRSTLADMAARMIARGLLARERSAADARANAVRLTPAGRRVLDDAGPKMARADQRLLKMLGEASKRQSLVSMLRELVKAGEAAEPAPEPRPASRATKPRPKPVPKPAPKPAARSAARR